MSEAPPDGDAWTMKLMTPERRRDPAHDLYDAACELLLAAQALRAAAGARGAAPSFAATVGCLDTSLEALAEAVDSMRDEAARAVARAGRPDGAGSAEAARREFSELVAALDAAHRGAGRMRERVGPMLARLTL